VETALSVISTASSSIQVKKEFDMLTDKFIEENCEIINNNVNYLSQTIDDFKNFIKKDKKRIHFKLVENMENFLTLIKGTVNNNHITVELDIDPSIEVEAFPNELIQCYMNIFNNSKDEFKIKNMKLRLFSIKAYKENKKTVIELLDNAGGIPEEILPKIYDPYFSTKFESKGTGIGLHMTYNIIVQGLRGDITAQNKEFEYKGKTCKGALFTIKI
jgi:signal transduction histidine kinase